MNIWHKLFNRPKFILVEEKKNAGVRFVIYKKILGIYEEVNTLYNRHDAEITFNKTCDEHLNRKINKSRSKILMKSKF